MVAAAFTCPACSRIFLGRDPVPPHRDFLCGRPCEGSGATVEHCMEFDLVEAAPSRPVLRTSRPRRRANLFGLGFGERRVERRGGPPDAGRRGAGLRRDG